MDTWQIKHINKNLPQLLQFTNCNVLFLASLRASKTIGLADEEAITSERGNLDKSSQLYKILQTRTNGYNNLAKALFLTNQTGALGILTNGYKEQNEINPITLCGIEIDYEALLSAEVHFQGDSYTLRDINENLTKEDLQGVLADSASQYDYIEYFVTQEKKFVLAEETIPKERSFYIPRFISNRLQLSPDMFKQNCNDVFVFKDIGQFQLTHIAERNFTTASTSQVNRITSRFIRLEDDADWEEIRNLATTPVHLVRIETQKYEMAAKINGKDDPNKIGGINVADSGMVYILEDTIGDSKILWQFAETQGTKRQAYISEDDLLANIDNPETAARICICDSPGMGKTWTLINLAHKMKQRQPKRLVAFISLAELTKHEKLFSKRLEIAKENSLNCVLKYICPSNLSRAILNTGITKQTTELILFLDALDEVDEEKLEGAKRFIRAISGDQGNIKVFVTSRKHLRRDLEQSIGVIAYDILQFTEANQIEYLVEQWKQRNPPGPHSKLTDIAETSVKNLRRMLTKNDRDLLGTPLICFLFAEVYYKQVCRLVRRLKESAIFELTSVNQLYQQYMDTKFNTTMKEDFEISENSNSHEILKQYHVWMALRHFYPDLAKEYALHHAVDVIGLTHHHLKIGIIELRYGRTGEVVEFVHQSLAEFLIAQYFVEILTANDIFNTANPTLVSCSIRTLVDGALKISIHNWLLNISECYVINYFKFANSEMTYFLNAQLNNIHFESANHKIGNVFAKTVSPMNFPKILECCVVGSTIGILRYFKNVLHTFSSVNLLIFRNFLLRKYLIRRGTDLPDEMLQPGCLMLYAVSVFSDRLILEELIEIFRDYFQYDLNEFCAQITSRGTNGRSPIENSIIRRDYHLVEYFIDKVPIDNMSLIFKCVEGSYDESPFMVEKRVEICKLLLTKQNDLVSEPCTTNGWNYGGPLVAERVHLKLLNLLIISGADIRAIVQKNTEKYTILHFAAKYMSADDFHHLCCMLPRDSKAADLFQTIPGLWNSPLHYIFCYQTLSRSLVQMLLQSSQADINQTDVQHSDNLLLSAVRGNNTVEIIKELLQQGASYEHTNCNGDSVLHLAAENGNVDVFDYFLSLRQPCYLSFLCWKKNKTINISRRDNSGRSSLLRAYQFPAMVNYLLNKGARILDCDKEGNNIAHCGAFNISSETTFHELAVLLLNINPNIFIARNKQLKTPLHVRLQKTDGGIRVDTLELLLPVPGMDVNSIDCDGNNLFISAVGSAQSLSILEALRIHGANYFARNNGGDTALNMAVSSRSSDALGYILFVDYGNKKLDMMSPLDIVIQEWSKIEHFGPNAVKLFELFLILMSGLNGRPTSDRMNNQYGNQNLSETDNLSTCKNDSNGTEIDENKQFLTTYFSRFVQAGNGMFETVLSKVMSDANGISLPHFTYNGNHDFQTEDKSSSISISTTHPYVAGAQLLRLTIDLGLNVIEQNSSRPTLANVFLQFLSGDQFHDVAKLLVEIGGSEIFWRPSNNGVSPIASAVTNMGTHAETFFLLSRSRDEYGNQLEDGQEQTSYPTLNCLNSAGLSILHLAVIFERRLDFILDLLELNERSVNHPDEKKVLNVLQQDRDGMTFLHCVTSQYAPEQYHQIANLVIQTGYGMIFGMADNMGTTPFFLAVERFELLPETLDLILGDSMNHHPPYINLEATDEHEKSALILAVDMKRNIDFILKLMKYCQICGNSKKNMTVQDVNGNTFLHYVPKLYSPEEFQKIAEYLIDRGFAKIFEIKNCNGWTPLHCAVSWLELLPTTLDLLLIGCHQNFRCDEFHKKKHTPQCFDLNVVCKNGNSILHMAIYNRRGAGFLNHLKKLIDDGAATGNGDTFRGVNLRIQNIRGDTFLHLFPGKYDNMQYHDLVVHLIRKGYGDMFSIINIEGHTPIHSAVRHLEILPETWNFLVSRCSTQCDTTHDHYSSQSYIDVSAVDHDRKSILQWAVEHKRSLELVVKLVCLGADWKHISKYGSNLVHISALYGLIEHIQYFACLGCNVNALDTDGNNTLQCALFNPSASENLLEIITFLIYFGADKCSKNKYNQTAYDRAIDAGVIDDAILKALDPSEV